MDDEIWFEEPLLLAQELVEETAKGLKGLDASRLAEESALDVGAVRQAADKAAALEEQVRQKARGVLRVHRPRWRPLTAAEAAALPTGWSDMQAGPLASGSLYLARLGIEFDLLPEGRRSGWSYTVAWCRAYLFAPGSAIQPRLLDIYPQRLYEGEPRTVKAEVAWDSRLARWRPR